MTISAVGTVAGAMVAVRSRWNSAIGIKVPLTKRQMRLVYERDTYDQLQNEI